MNCIIFAFSEYMKKLLSQLIANKVLKTKVIIEAFESIDRKDFVLEKYSDLAYEDIALSIDFGQTISQPTTVAFMLELLKPARGQKILEVGSGSGWVAAMLAEIVGSTGKIFGLEIIPKLATFGRKNLAKYNLPQAEIIQAEKNLGLPKEAPFDRILVSASASVFPNELIHQLKNGGILVLPIRNSIYKIVKKSEMELITHEFPGFIFVPLVN